MNRASISSVSAWRPLMTAKWGSKPARTLCSTASRQGASVRTTTLAADGYLAGSVGMLTDSRSFLSYARHEYFRRILCELLGSWVENGEFPPDEKALRTITEGVCFRNAERFFHLSV